MKRWTITNNGSCEKCKKPVKLEPNLGGEWVKAEDAQKEISFLESKVLELVKPFAVISPRKGDPHVHDGIPCKIHKNCQAHLSHPCEGCGRQWPVKSPRIYSPEYLKEVVDFLGQICSVLDIGGGYRKPDAFIEMASEQADKAKSLISKVDRAHENAKNSKLLFKGSGKFESRSGNVSKQE